MIFDSPVPSSTQKANREELQDQSAKYKVVTPGEVITSDPMYMR